MGIGMLFVIVFFVVCWGCCNGWDIFCVVFIVIEFVVGVFIVVNGFSYGLGILYVIFVVFILCLIMMVMMCSVRG